MLHHVCALDMRTIGPIKVACPRYLERTFVEALSQNIESVGISRVSMPEICRYYNVVFPLPLDPMIAVKVPRGMSAEIFRKSGIEDAPVSTSTDSLDGLKSCCNRLDVLEVISLVTERFRIWLIKV